MSDCYSAGVPSGHIFTLRLMPASPRIPAWYLVRVQEGLSTAPFEPIESVFIVRYFSETFFFSAISSLKRTGNPQDLLVFPSCLEFAPGMVKAFLHPRPGYVPKVPTYVA